MIVLMQKSQAHFSHYVENLYESLFVKVQPKDGDVSAGLVSLAKKENFQNGQVERNARSKPFGAILSCPGVPASLSSFCLSPFIVCMSPCLFIVSLHFFL